MKEEDFKVLDNDRPLGISGHMRVRNEAMSVAECIESCIDFLDELIITYNTSTDNTEQILEEYKNKYPDKIRLYHYKPNIIRCDVYEFNDKYSYVHSLSNYYNFGYIKIEYKYYMKIDADQIYFTEKLLEVRRALLKDIDVYYKKILNIKKILWWIPIKYFRDRLKTYYFINTLNSILNKNYFTIDDIKNTYDLILYCRLIYNFSVSFNMGG